MNKLRNGILILVIIYLLAEILNEILLIEDFLKYMLSDVQKNHVKLETILTIILVIMALAYCLYVLLSGIRSLISYSLKNMLVFTITSLCYFVLSIALTLILHFIKGHPFYNLGGSLFLIEISKSVIIFIFSLLIMLMRYRLIKELKLSRLNQIDENLSQSFYIDTIKYNQDPVLFKNNN